MTTLSISRSDLIEVVDYAATGITPSTRAKLLEVAKTTEAVAVGWWHCDGVNCPARQARRKNQGFQEAFDRAMSARFGRPDPLNDDEAAPFVVVVDGEAGHA